MFIFQDCARGHADILMRTSKKNTDLAKPTSGAPQFLAGTYLLMKILSFKSLNLKIGKKKRIEII